VESANGRVEIGDVTVEVPAGTVASGDRITVSVGEPIGACDLLSPGEGRRIPGSVVPPEGSASQLNSRARVTSRWHASATATGPSLGRHDAEITLSALEYERNQFNCPALGFGLHERARHLGR
jgi:hypothetical protein